MNTNYKITALLHGELVSDPEVEELLHVLAVSPEKRSLLLDEIRLSRELLRTKTSLPSPLHGAEGLWSQFVGESSGASAVSTTGTIIPSPQSEHQRKTLPILLLLLCGIVGGYLLGSHSMLRESTALFSEEQRSDLLTQSDVSPTTTERLYEEVAPLTAKNHNSTYQLDKELTALHADLQHERTTAATLRNELQETRDLLKSLQRDYAKLQEEQGTDRTPSLLSLTKVRENQLAQTIEPQNVRFSYKSRRPSITLYDFPLSSQPSVTPWRIETRQFLRTSLPTVQGLHERTSLLSNREIGASLKISHQQLPASTRTGIAVGETRFSQVYHTNTGGAPNDTIIEQSPSLLYGRAYIAPELFTDDRITGNVEIGAGGTEIGPIGTIGIGVDYKISDHITVQGGLSSWLLWTSFRNQLHTSTNVNAHFGIAIQP